MVLVTSQPICANFIRNASDDGHTKLRLCHTNSQFKFIILRSCVYRRTPGQYAKTNTVRAAYVSQATSIRRKEFPLLRDDRGIGLIEHLPMFHANSTQYDSLGLSPAPFSSRTATSSHLHIKFKRAPSDPGIQVYVVHTVTWPWS